MGALLTKVTQHGTLESVRYLTPVPPAAASGLVRATYQQLQRDFGLLAPPVILHSPAPRVLAATWTLLRESLVAAGGAGRAAKETVALGVSAANSCPYCVQVHGTTLQGVAGTTTGDAALTAWAGDTGLRSRAGRPPPASAGPAPELIAVAVAFHYLNRMVNVFLGESPLPPGLPDALTPLVRRLVPRVLGPIARRRRPPGLALDLLPAGPLPDDLAWAAGHPTLGPALGRAATAYELAGVRSVPAPVRDLVLARLREWDGTPAGPSTGWVEREVSGLVPADRDAGRLALLTAFASYQVAPALPAAFGSDRELVEVTAWAAFAAARRIGSWAGPAPGVNGR